MIFELIFIVIITFLLTLIFTEIFIKIGFLTKFIGIDLFKKNHPKIPLSGGFAIISSFLLGIFLLYYVRYADIKLFEGVSLSLLIISAIGFLDDHIKGLPGFFKPLFSIFGGIPIIFFKLYNFHLNIFGGIGFSLPIVYPFLILIAFAIVTNTVNMLDVINGSAVTGSIFVLISILICYYIISGSIPYLTLIFIISLLGFLVFNIYPAKIFLGNMGSLLLGASIVISAIYYRVEFPAMIAMMPFIHNSFFYLYKVKGFVEHKKIGVKVTYFNDMNENIYDGCDDSAPLTLLRFIVSRYPKKEYEAYLSIIIPFILSSILAILTVMIFR